MKNVRSFFFFLVCLGAILVGFQLAALESSSTSLEKSTSELKDLSVKPLKVYSARGRKDPFLAPMFFSNQPEVWDLKISELNLVGFVSAGPQRVVLFNTNAGPAQTLTLRAGVLYGSNNKPVPNISGKLIGSKKVFLKQGEEKLTFSAAN